MRRGPGRPDIDERRQVGAIFALLGRLRIHDVNVGDDEVVDLGTQVVVEVLDVDAHDILRGNLNTPLVGREVEVPAEAVAVAREQGVNARVRKLEHFGAALDADIPTECEALVAEGFVGAVDPPLIFLVGPLDLAGVFDLSPVLPAIKLKKGRVSEDARSHHRTRSSRW